MRVPSAKDLLRRLRDGWLKSISSDGLVPGPFVTDRDICALETSTGWAGTHLAEAVRRSFSPFDDRSIDRLFQPPVPIRGGGRRDDELDLLAILAGRIPALAAKVVFHGIGAGMRVTMKPSSSEPEFARLLAKSATAVDPDAPVAVTQPERAVVGRLVKSAAICLVYGSDETVNAIRESRKKRPTFTGPHMESYAVVFASALETTEKSLETASRIAVDTAIYDQSGCLSPVAVLVQEGGAASPGQFADMLLGAIIQSPIQAGTGNSETLAPVRMFLQEATLPGQSGRVLTGPDGIPPAVVMSHKVRPSPGWRTVQLVSFDSPAPDLNMIMPHLNGKIQGVSFAGTSGEISWLIRANPKFKGHYICESGKLQDPPALWPENGIVLAHELRASCADI